MTAAELLDQLNRAGATVEIVDGKPRLRGAKIPTDLMEAVKARRADILRELEQRRECDRDRYGRVPDDRAALLAGNMALLPASRQKLVDYVMRQPRPVHAWIMMRANEYFQRGIAAEDCEWRACVDVVTWQRQTNRQAAVDFVVNFPSNQELNLP